MADEATRTCVECQGTMSRIVMMDFHYGGVGELTYRQPNDRVSFWKGGFPTAGKVRAFLCEGCGRIALYGAKPGA